MAAVDLAYEEFGRNNSRPLLILHGFFASSRNWRQISERLSGEAGFHVFALDLRHHGESPHLGVMDYPAMTEDVLGFMDGRELASVHILGHSMGGKIAMWLALNQPHRIGKLIVADIAPKSYNHRFDGIINALMGLPLDSLQNRKEAEAMLAEAIPQLSYRQFLLQNLVLQEGEYQWRIDLEVFLRSAKNITGFPETANLAPYQKEVIFIAGADSDYVSETDVKKLFPNAGFRLIADAGHWLHVQKPDVFIEVVENFLQRE